MPSNPWGPDEPASVVLSEEAWLQGATLSSIAYGASLVLSIQCFSLLLKQTKRSNYRMKVPFLVIVILIFMFGTFFIGSTMKFNQLAFVENRNYPGGPSKYESDMFAIPVDSLGNVSSTLSLWLCDALIVWRYMMIFKGCNAPMWIVMALPVLLILGSFVTGILFLLQLSASSLFVSSGLNWTIPYFSISLAINILVSIAIVSRLLLFRHRITSVLGSNHGSHYTSIAAMIIESASLFSAFAILFIISFALNNFISEVFLQAMGQVQSCATLLIILRAASGKAWSSETKETLMPMQFATRAHRASGSVRMKRTGHLPTTAGSTPAAGSHLNDSLATLSYNVSSASASRATTGNGMTIAIDIETDTDGQSLNGEDSGDNSYRA